ncbi:hypothetical protein GCM10016272_15860 [Psychrobacter glaciei]|uniref:Uncharacterized protein n=1 Tax=Psychrobacter glaciei TaxID=619771 RepID=A0ABQ3GT96_9GAMM|nr:hypothetical protein GCM10016272_15860 [Psychrobacter glaciei]
MQDIIALLVLMQEVFKSLTLVNASFTCITPFMYDAPDDDSQLNTCLPIKITSLLTLVLE